MPSERIFTTPDGRQLIACCGVCRSWVYIGSGEGSCTAVGFAHRPGDYCGSFEYYRPEPAPGDVPAGGGGGGR